MNAAAASLNHQGVSQTSLAEIAQAVGVSRAALYYYFEDHEDLVFQCYRHTCEQIARSLNDATRAGGSVFDVINAFIEKMLSEGEPEVAALNDVAYLGPEKRSTITGLYEGLRAKLAQIIEEGVRKGECRPCRAELVAPALIGLVSWIPTLRHWRSAAPLSRREFIDQTEDLIASGVAAHRAAPVQYEPLVLTAPDLPAGRVFDPKAMAAARQEALLASASWLFKLKGVDSTSLDEIAHRVGVTKKVIYHNMGDKQALVVQCYRRAFRFYESVVARMRAYDGPRIDAICACMHAFAEASLREDIAPLPLVAGLESLLEEEQEALQATIERLISAHFETFAHGWAEGSVRQVNVRAAINLTPGYFEWLPKWYESLSESEREAAPLELATLFRIGLRPL